MSSAPTQILVPVVPKATTAPLVLVDASALAAIAHAEQRVGALKITDIATYQGAVSLLNDLTISATKLEKTRTELKAPFLEIGKKIDACAKGAADRIETLKRKVRGEIQAHDTRQREEAARIERERQAEIARLEAEKLRQQQEAAKKAAALAAQNAPTDLDFADDAPPEAPKTAIDARLEALKFAPAAPAPAVSGLSFRVRLLARVVDVAKIPDAFVTRSANEKLIRETYCVGFKEGDKLPELPGVTFEIDRQPISNGKGGNELF